MLPGSYNDPGNLLNPIMERPQAAESSKDFIHKLRISLKELRETQRWLNLIRRVPLIKDSEILDELSKETDELIRIFVDSIKTAQRNK